MKQSPTPLIGSENIYWNNYRPHNTREINLYRIRGLLVFIGKNGKALKRRKYKVFCVFLLYGIVLVLLKYGENEVKKG